MLFGFSDIFYVLILCVCIIGFLSLMVCCFNQVLVLLCGMLCLVSFFSLLLFFDFSLFIIIFFLIYSSFFLVMLLCVLMFIPDDMYFSIYWVILFLFFLFLFLFLDGLIYYFGYSFYAYFNGYNCYKIYDLIYYFIVNDFSDTGLLGDLLFIQFPFFVILVGFFLFLGLISVPLLLYSVVKIQGVMLRNSNKYMLKRVIS